MHKSMMILFLLLLTSSVNASTIYFRGEITHSSDPYLMGASVGDTFTGNLTYDLDTYGGEEECSSGFGECYFDWNFNIGPYYYSNWNGGDITYISINNGSNSDNIGFHQTSMEVTLPTNAPVNDFVEGWFDIFSSLSFIDETGQALENSDMPTPYELASSFNNGLLDYWGDGLAEDDLKTYRLKGQINNVSVPEPTTILLFGTGLAGLIGFRMRRKKNYYPFCKP